MKRMAFYRRAGPKDAPLAGLKERVVWRLSKGPATGTELAEIFNVTRVKMNHLVGKWLPYQGVVQITASEWFLLPDGGKDRTYTLERKPKRLAEPGESPKLTKNAICYANEETRRINTERAKRRARLIAAGIYIDELG